MFCAVLAYLTDIFDRPCLFAHPGSGLLHFSRTAFNGTDVVNLPRPYANDTVERLSACECHATWRQVHLSAKRLTLLGLKRLTLSGLVWYRSVL